MIRRLRSWLARRFGGDADERAADDGTEGTAFSVLDASVRYAHGSSEAAGIRELQAVDERARELEATDQDDR